MVHCCLVHQTGPLSLMSDVSDMGQGLDNVPFLRILRAHLASYNAHRAACRQQIVDNGGVQVTDGRRWYPGSRFPDGRLAEFDEDMVFPVLDLSQQSPRSDADAQFSYATVDIDVLCDDLGIPWQAEKTTPWASSFIFTGLLWDLNAKTVTLPEAKRLKYLSAVREWLAGPRTRSLEEVEKLYGKLLHTSLVFPKGRAYLTSLEAALGTYKANRWIKHTPPAGTPDDIRWWEHLLDSPLLPRLIPGPLDVQDLEAYSDASSGVGIGIMVGGRWRAWRLRDGWQRGGREIGWAEAVGFELLVRAILHLGEHSPSFVVYGDNRGIVEGWWNGRSRSRLVNEVFRRLHRLLQTNSVSIHTRYVASKHNPADGPSRGMCPRVELQLPRFPIPEELTDFLDDFSPSASIADSWPGAHSKPIRDPTRAHRSLADLSRQRSADHGYITNALGDVRPFPS